MYENRLIRFLIWMIVPLIKDLLLGWAWQKVKKRFEQQ